MDSMKDAGLLSSFLTELIINMIIVPPYYESIFKIKGSVYVYYDYSQYLGKDFISPTDEKSLIELVYSLSNILTVIILLRSYQYIRIFHTYSYWATPKADSICKLMNTEATVGFGIKAYLKINPFLTLGISIFFVILFFGFAMRIFEFYGYQTMKTIQDDQAFVPSMMKFENLFNSFWLILVTMTTSKWLP